MSEFKEWADKVEAFLEENQELADDPTLGQSASQRLLLDTTNLLTPLMSDLTALMHQQEEAANKLADAINDPHCSAGKVDKREKEYERLKAEQEELEHWQDKLEALREKAHDIYMAKSDEPTISHLDFAPEETEEAPKRSLWQRLFR